MAYAWRSSAHAVSGIALEVESLRAQLAAEQAEVTALLARDVWLAERSPSAAVALDEANALLASAHARAFRIAEHVVARSAVARNVVPKSSPTPAPLVAELTLF